VTDFAELSIAEAGGLLRARKISPVEYTQALLDRIVRHDGALNAFLRLMPDEALAAAKTAEAQIMAGDWRGPMHGVPYALKDIIDAAGVPTTCHSKIFADAKAASADAHVTGLLRRAGAILLGKTSTHEFAIGGPSFDLPWPPARNPWNREHFPGGSSSGSGAALAAGFVPAALGSDTGGSVRNPASFCGLAGMKPTYGRVSRRGVFPLSYSLDHVGPMTRTVADNAILLNVLAGHDAADPGSADRAAPDFSAALERGVSGLRIGVIRHFFDGDLHADAEMKCGIENALDVLRGLGAKVRDIALTPLGDYAAANRIILLSEAFAIHETWFRERPQDYGSSTRRRVRIRRYDARYRRRHYRLQHGLAGPARRSRGVGTRLWPPGAPAVQSDRRAGAGRADRVFVFGLAIVDADRGQEFRRSDDLPRRPCLRTGGRLDRAAAQTGLRHPIPSKRKNHESE